MWHWNMGPGWGWGGMLIGGLVMLLFWGGLFTLSFLAIRALMRSDQERRERQSLTQDGETPLEVLQKRYARGEISREEYLEIKRDLETRSTAP